jgi:hypothetical protein
MKEDLLQQKIVIWFKNNYCLRHHVPRCSIFSVPNGGSRNIIEAKRLKATGMKAGVSDLIILIPGKTIFIELKNENGKQSLKQKEFQETVLNLNQEYYLLRSLDEFKSLINGLITL